MKHPKDFPVRHRLAKRLPFLYYPPAPEKVRYHHDRQISSCENQLLMDDGVGRLLYWRVDYSVHNKLPKCFSVQLGLQQIELDMEWPQIDSFQPARTLSAIVAILSERLFMRE